MNGVLHTVFEFQAMPGAGGQKGTVLVILPQTGTTACDLGTFVHPGLGLLEATLSYQSGLSGGQGQKSTTQSSRRYPGLCS